MTFRLSRHQADERVQVANAMPVAPGLAGLVLLAIMISIGPFASTVYVPSRSPTVRRALER